MCDKGRLQTCRLALWFAWSSTQVGLNNTLVRKNNVLVSYLQVAFNNGNGDMIIQVSLKNTLVRKNNVLVSVFAVSS